VIVGNTEVEAERDCDGERFVGPMPHSRVGIEHDI